MEKIVNKLINLHKTISTMESCTGGYIANAITNIEGASSIFKFGAVTYSNEFKIKMGVTKKVIDDYTVYSIETAINMSKAISDYTLSDYGIGVTGKINRKDENNDFNEDNIIYASIYDRINNCFYTLELKAINDTREANKKMITDEIIKKLKEIICD